MNPIFPVAIGLGAAALFMKDSKADTPPIDHKDNAQIASLRGQIADQEKYAAQVQLMITNAGEHEDTHAYEIELNRVVALLNSLGGQLNQLENA